MIAARRRGTTPAYIVGQGSWFSVGLSVKSESGQSLPEYILLIALIALLSLGAWQLFGSEVGRMMEQNQRSVSQAGE